MDGFPTYAIDFASLNMGTTSVVSPALEAAPPAATVSLDVAGNSLGAAVEAILTDPNLTLLLLVVCMMAIRVAHRRNELRAVGWLGAVVVSPWTALDLAFALQYKTSIG